MGLLWALISALISTDNDDDDLDEMMLMDEMDEED